MDTAQVERLFWENFERYGEVGASLSIWHRGREVVSLAGGSANRTGTTPWTRDTPTVVWSATKGPSSATVLRACESAGLSVDTPVSDIWPEFAAGGKASVTIRHLLSHRAGLPYPLDAMPIHQCARIADALANQAPVTEVGGRQSTYHPRTYGPLVDRVVRILTGMSLGEFWRQQFALPLQLDFWIGRPLDAPGISPAPVLAPRGAPPAGDPFYQAYGTPDSPVNAAFMRLRGLSAVSAMNLPENQAMPFPAFAGVGTASALGKFYAMLAGGGVWEGQTFLKNHEWCTETVVNGFDATLLTEIAFSAGFMKDPVDELGRKMRNHYGPSTLAFGHPGAGGSFAFADPEHDVAFAYVMNQMEYGVLPNGKSHRLVQALYGEIVGG